MMETFRILAPLAWRNLWRNPRRTVITLIVVSVGLYSILFFAALIEAWADASRDRALNVMTGSGQIHTQGYADDPTIGQVFPQAGGELLAYLEGPEISGWAPRVRVPAVVQSEYRTMPLTLIGVNPTGEKAISIVPDGIVEGAYLSGPDDPTIFLGQSMVDRLKTRLGKRVIILAQNSDGTLAEQSFEVGGIYDGFSEIEDMLGFAGLETVQTLLGAEGQLSEIAYRVTDEARLDQVGHDLGQIIPELDVQSWKDLSPMAAMAEESMGVAVFIWLWVMFILMAFGIINTQLMAVFERVHEFGLLQALGMRPRMILLIVTLESSILVGIGTLMGIAGAVATIQAMSGGLDISFLAEGAAMAGVGQVLYLKLDWGQLIELSIIVWLLSVAVTYWPARKASKFSPVEAMAHVS